MTFDETPPPSKTSPLVNDDLDEEEAIKITEKKKLENDIVDETLEIDEIKQTALAISTTEAEYVSVGKACQQALWMKQALIDYDVQLDDIPIMYDNKGAIDQQKPSATFSNQTHQNSSPLSS
ncbi:hypothetical protein Tco_0468313 [Tanacetum coccineum]